jgi:integrase
VEASKMVTNRKRFIKTFGKPIEDYSAIKRAVECVGERTKDSYYRVLPDYFIFLGESPNQVIEQRRKDILEPANFTDAERYEKRTIKYVRHLMKSGIAGRTIQNTILGRIQGFFSNNAKVLSLDMRRKPKLSKARKKLKYSPTNEEIRHLYSVADSARDRLIIAVMYQMGPAPVDVAGLQVGDLPTEPWRYFERSRSKTGEVWRGVVTPDISAELKAYLKIREVEVKQYLESHKGAEEPEALFIGRKGPLDNQGISDIVSDLIKKADLNGIDGFKPTSLRDAFEDTLVEANVHVKIKEALMGHTSDIQHQYGSAKRLRIACVQAIKKAYPKFALNGYAREEATPIRKELDQLREDYNQLKALVEKLIAKEES